MNQTTVEHVDLGAGKKGLRILFTGEIGKSGTHARAFAHHLTRNIRNITQSDFKLNGEDPFYNSNSDIHEPPIYIIRSKSNHPLKVDIEGDMSDLTALVVYASFEKNKKGITRNPHQRAQGNNSTTYNLLQRVESRLTINPYEGRYIEE